MGRAADTLRRMSHSVLPRSRRVLREHLMALSLVTPVGQNVLCTDLASMTVFAFYRPCVLSLGLKNVIPAGRSL